MDRYLLQNRNLTGESGRKIQSSSEILRTIKQIAVKPPQFYRYFFVQKNSTKIKNNILIFSYTIFKIIISEKRKGERYD